MSALVVGVPSEIKNNENRVSVQPDGVAELVHHGHQVLVEAGAGTGSRFGDAEYAAAGAKVVGARHDLRARPGVLVVGEPGSFARARLHEHLVAAVHQLDDAVGRERHPLLVVLDFARHPDDERAHAGISRFEK